MAFFTYIDKPFRRMDKKAQIFCKNAMKIYFCNGLVYKSSKLAG